MWTQFYDIISRQINYHLSLIPKEQVSNPREPAGDQLMLNHLRRRTDSDTEILQLTGYLDEPTNWGYD